MVNQGRRCLDRVVHGGPGPGHRRRRSSTWPAPGTRAASHRSGTESIQVTVTVTAPTQVLSIIGIDSMTSTGSATASLVTGVTGPGSNDPRTPPRMRGPPPGHGAARRQRAGDAGRPGRRPAAGPVQAGRRPAAAARPGLAATSPRCCCTGTTARSSSAPSATSAGSRGPRSPSRWSPRPRPRCAGGAPRGCGSAACRTRPAGSSRSSRSRSPASRLRCWPAPRASVVTVSAVRPGPPAAQPARPASRTIRTEASTADPAAPQVMSMGFSQMVTVRSGDCLWSIAQRYLGNGDLYPEIVKLNLGHDMGGGQKFTDPSVIWPGWVLQLPASPAGLSSADSPAAGAPTAASHAGHDSRDPRFSHPHPAATRARRRSGRRRRHASGRPAVPHPPAPAAVAVAPAHAAAPSRQDASFARPAELSRDPAVRRVRRGRAGRRGERGARPDAPPPAAGPPLRQADPGAGRARR